MSRITLYKWLNKDNLYTTEADLLINGRTVIYYRGKNGEWYRFSYGALVHGAMYTDYLSSGCKNEISFNAFIDKNILTYISDAIVYQKTMGRDEMTKGEACNTNPVKSIWRNLTARARR